MRISDWSSDVCSSDLARIEWLWNQIFRAEFDTVRAIGRRHDVVLLFLGQLGNSLDGCFFHAARNRGGAHVERPAKYIWKTQNVIDLIRVAGTARGNDHVVAHRAGLLRTGFGPRIGKGKNKRPGGKFGNNLQLSN